MPKTVAINPDSIRRELESQQLKQWWVAEQIGVNPKTLTRWLNGSVAKARLGALQRLAALLGCDHREFVQLPDRRVSSDAERLRAALALLAPGTVEKFMPAHDFALLEQLARGLLLPALDRGQLGAMYMTLCLALFRQGKLPEAAHYAALAGDIALETGDQRLMLRARMQQSYQHYLEGDATACIAGDEDNLALAREVGDRANEAACLSNLGDLYHQYGDFNRARKLQREAIDLYSELRIATALTFALIGLAMLEIEAGNREEAHQAIVRARTAAVATSFRRGLADCNRVEALLLAGNDDDRAEALMASALAEYGELGIAEVMALVHAGRVYGHRDRDRSKELLRAALSLAREKSLPIHEAFAMAALSRLEPGYADKAVASFRRAGLVARADLLASSAAPAT